MSIDESSTIINLSCLLLVILNQVLTTNNQPSSTIMNHYQSLYLTASGWFDLAINNHHYYQSMVKPVTSVLIDDCPTIINTGHTRGALLKSPLRQLQQRKPNNFTDDDQHDRP